MRLLLALTLLAGCQTALIDVDVTALTRVPGLPAPADYVVETVPWELDADWVQKVEARTTHYHSPGSPAGSPELFIPHVVSVRRTADDPQDLAGAVGIAALRYTTTSLARQDARRLKRYLRAHACERESARNLLSGSHWADDVYACRNLPGGGSVRVMWRYRNVIVYAGLRRGRPGAGRSVARTVPCSGCACPPPARRRPVRDPPLTLPHTAPRLVAHSRPRSGAAALGASTTAAPPQAKMRRAPLPGGQRAASR